MAHNHEGPELHYHGDHVHHEGEETCTDPTHNHHHHRLSPVVRTAPKIGRNEPCLCGSGKKFKKCHGA